jgi:hypothetical protein
MPCYIERTRAPADRQPGSVPHASSDSWNTRQTSCCFLSTLPPLRRTRQAMCDSRPVFSAQRLRVVAMVATHFDRLALAQPRGRGPDPSLKWIHSAPEQCHNSTQIARRDTSIITNVAQAPLSSILQDEFSLTVASRLKYLTYHAVPLLHIAKMQPDTPR